MTILVVYNPNAGNSRAKKLLPKIKHYLQSASLNFDLQVTQYAGHATKIVEQAELSNVSAVIACGGDGTLFEVVNGIQNNPAKIKPPLGLIPNGTGNAFMKELGLKQSDWKVAIDIIAKGHTRRVDIGQFSCQSDRWFFINMVGLGFVTEVAVSAIRWKWLGNAAYTLATLLKLVRLKAQPMQLEIDGKIIQRKAVFVEVANSRYTGTKFLMAPDAKVDDGQFELVVLNQISRLRLLRLFTSIYDGSHVRYPEVEVFRCQKAKIETQDQGQLIPDGEVLGSLPVEFEILPAQVQLFWPG